VTVSRDPEEAETRTIQELIDFSGKDVLEVGAGDGRMTWRYAALARSVVALDPNADALARAEVGAPKHLRSTVRFWPADITTAEVPVNAFDLAVLSWSLCCVAPAGLVKALENIYTALRPGGLLLDVRPARRHPWVEVQRAHENLRLGQLDDSYRIGTQVSADAAVKSMIDTGRFQQERRTRFLFVYHFDTVDGWLDYMAADWQSAHISRAMIARARDAFPPGSDGDMRILRWITATRLRRT